MIFSWYRRVCLRQPPITVQHTLICYNLLPADADNELPTIQVSGAHIIQTFESANAILPFMTVPFIGGNQFEVRSTACEMSWDWTFLNVSALPGIHNDYFAEWRLHQKSAGSEAGCPLAHVRFHSRKQGQNLREKEQLLCFI